MIIGCVTEKNFRNAEKKQNIIVSQYIYGRVFIATPHFMREKI